MRELEVKILNIDAQEMENRIKNRGGVLIGKERQINTLLDSTERPIKSYMDAYLRIRETTDLISGGSSVEFTLKKNIANQTLRENKEINVRVDSRDSLLEIMQNLGFGDISVGYKERTSYSYKKSRIDIDQWDMDTYPFPYLEIEVQDEKDLEEVIEDLDIDQNQVSKLSIVQLQRLLKKGEGEQL